MNVLGRDALMAALRAAARRAGGGYLVVSDAGLEAAALRRAAGILGQPKCLETR